MARCLLSLLHLRDTDLDKIPFLGLDSFYLGLLLWGFLGGILDLSRGEGGEARSGIGMLGKGHFI